MILFLAFTLFILAALLVGFLEYLSRMARITKDKRSKYYYDL